MDKLTPQLNQDQLRQNIDALQKGGMGNDKVQSYVNNYSLDKTGNYVLKQPTQPQNQNSGYLNSFGNTINQGAQNITNDYNSLKSTPENSNERTLGAISLVGHTVGNIASTAGGLLGDAVSPIIPQVVKDKIGDVSQYINQKVDSIPGMTPEIHKSLGDVFNTLTLGLGAEGEGAVKSAASSVTKNAIEGLPGAIDKGIDATRNTIESGKNLIKPSLTAEEATGKIIQGTPEDIAPSTRAIKSLDDTSKIKTYKDLNDATNAKIKQLSSLQDTTLSKDTNSYKIQQLATKVGDTEAAHNYVNDAVQQLKEYYTKTNDIKNLQKIKSIETKIDPVKGKGLSLKEVNDLAKMHGSDLNGYNANGELASGLTKQAAENTRQGLKNTIRNLMPDETSKNIDSKISDLYRLRDSSKDMMDKVNSITQKTTKQGVIPKIVGKTVSKTIKGIDAITGNPLRAVGREMGNIGSSNTMSPLEIESNLRKYLSAINK